VQVFTVPVSATGPVQRHGFQVGCPNGKLLFTAGYDTTGSVELRSSMPLSQGGEWRFDFTGGDAGGTFTVGIVCVNA
jgi:hypothetical protein